MNILGRLLFSFEGKIGRADYIYGILYAVLLFFVSVDAFVRPESVFLIWQWMDVMQLLVYVLSFIGIGAFIWIYLALLIKRARTLWIELSYTILAILFPPLLLVGLQKDTTKHTYNGPFVLLDQIFFIGLLAGILLCIFFLYDTSILATSILVTWLIIAVVAGVFFGLDRRYAPHKNKYSGWDSWLDLIFVLLIVFFVRSYIVSPFQIIGPSMEDTFQWWKISYVSWKQVYGDGEFILVDKMSYRFSEPKRGDVVVFTPGVWPEKRFLIKRIIGIPWDTVKVENWYVSVMKEWSTEFVQLDELSYLWEVNGQTCLSYVSNGCMDGEVQTVVIPEGNFFLLGDNRPESLDARKCFHNLGCVGDYRQAQFVPLAHIQWRVAFSLGHFDAFSQILPFPKIGTLEQVLPIRGKNIENFHIYPELDV